ncbi:O-methyltransferase [Dermacoccus sp. Tok2021]|uniref:O-methyltransferase n=1 Tax=Dermacoccus sp. Tok2021 TaxID=2826873 RepID=UPI001CA77260|nr:O-methyltransferase [Dermacoccus sp. Tok2021]MBZ4497903.1 O-methyltransferase [Dermacoccus sp. Tok2021]
MIVRPVVEKYAEDASSPAPDWLASLVADTEASTDLPAMMVGRLEGELLASLVFVLQPRRILEIGTFTGYSALCMAQAMPTKTELVTCELDPLHASIARKHFEASPWSDRITLLEGPAADSVAGLEGPFDLVFIDADKPGYVGYYEAVLPKLAPRGLILADNVLQFGGVANERDQQLDTVAMREFNAHVAADSRVRQSVLTVREGISVIRWAS